MCNPRGNEQSLYSFADQLHEYYKCQDFLIIYSQICESYYCHLLGSNAYHHGIDHSTHATLHRPYVPLDTIHLHPMVQQLVEQDKIHARSKRNPSICISSTQKCKLSLMSRFTIG